MAANQEWALDFVHDAVECGRAIRVLSVNMPPRPRGCNSFAKEHASSLTSTMPPQPATDHF
jgi:hypothetical protein